MICYNNIKQWRTLIYYIKSYIGIWIKKRLGKIVLREPITVFKNMINIFFASFSLLFHILHNVALNKCAKYLSGNEHLRQVRQFTILKKSAVTSFEDTEGYIKGGHEERKDMAGKKKCWHSIEAKRKTCTHRKQFCYSDKTFIALKANTII